MGAQRDAQCELEDQWIAAAQNYLKSYPQGHYAFEPRFRMGEIYQHKGEYLEAAKEYDQVQGNSDYDFTARFNAAECYYRALAAAGGVKRDNASSLTPIATPADAHQCGRSRSLAPARPSRR